MLQETEGTRNNAMLYACFSRHKTQNLTEALLFYTTFKIIFIHRLEDFHAKQIILVHIFV